jgi:pimeloyl-ACP methyl ester carboxylesterase
MANQSPPIVLIHGLWTIPSCWSLFKNYLEERGHTVYAPAWPRIQDDVEVMWKNPSMLKGMGITEIVDYYEKYIRSLSEPPVLIGHSFGGLIVQLLLDRGLGCAGVAIASASPKGVFKITFSMIKSLSPLVFNPFNYYKTVTPAFDKFYYAVANTLPEQEARELFDDLTIPASGRLIFQAATANLNPWAASKVNYRNNQRAPLLLIACSNDHICPAKLIRENYKNYRHSSAVTEYKEFVGPCHYIIRVENWCEVAMYAVSWAEEKISCL